MSRPIKKTVDYFPHQTNHGKTMFIVESRWGNDGYAFWFKLLEVLGGKEGMFIDCKNPAEWEFLLAKTRITEVVANEILQTLAKLEAIHPELWEKGVIYSQNLVNNVSDAYKRRIEEKPTLDRVNAYINSQNATNMQTKTGKGKGKGKGKEEPPCSPPTEKPKIEKSEQMPFAEAVGLYREVTGIPKTQPLNSIAQAKLQDLIHQYPRGKLEEAMDLTALAQKPNMHYLIAVLEERWNGRDSKSKAEPEKPKTAEDWAGDFPTVTEADIADLQEA